MACLSATAEAAAAVAGWQAKPAAVVQGKRMDATHSRTDKFTNNWTVKLTGLRPF